VPHDKAVVLEDATSGVAAGAAGEFGLVIGVDRGAGADALTEAGAHLVVTDLAELL
jgi:beta-phosphoglucomutase-like phosphatase (HAD superfamily)